MASLHNGHAAAVKSRLLSGVKLQLNLPTLSATFQAILGLELQTGAVALTHTTPRQTAALLPVPMVFFRTVAAATPLELAAMRRGDFTVEALHKEHLANRRMSDTELKRILLREGLGRVFDMLDELTRPAGKTNGHATDHANDNDGNGGAAMPGQLSL
jgi:hypothetical protein